MSWWRVERGVRKVTQSTRAALGLFYLVFGANTFAANTPNLDWRNITNGFQIPSAGYSDQAYVVITRDHNWLAVMTTGKGREGDAGQHVASTISTDQGRTWSPLNPIEPPDGPEASWATPLITPSGRVYVCYDYNGDQVRKLRGNTVGAGFHPSWAT
jgi:hypothetical protein